MDPPILILNKKLHLELRIRTHLESFMDRCHPQTLVIIVHHQCREKKRRWDGEGKGRREKGNFIYFFGLFLHFFVLLFLFTIHVLFFFPFFIVIFLFTIHIPSDAYPNGR